MAPGTKVRRRPDGATGVVVRCEDQQLIVERPNGDVVSWHRSTVIVLVTEHKAKGTVFVSDRARAAHRQWAEGTASVRDLAELHQVSQHTIRDWIARVRESEQDLRNLGRQTG